MSINIARIGLDGKRPYQLRFGKSWRRNVALFGEKVMWVPPGKHPGGVTTNWKTNGVWLGIANFGA
eukprot:11634282-Karenia_brevis.AAC.1